MQLRNSAERFGLVALGLHWLVAALFLVMLAIGFAMTNLPLTHPWTFPLYQLHKSIGATIFLLVAFRLCWRWLGEVPPLPASLTPLERMAARLTHGGLYAALLAMPLAGWVIVSASPLGIPTVLFGLIRLPHISFVAAHPQKKEIGALASSVHEGLAWAALALVALHVAAALWHHAVRKDDVLRRMLPARVLFARKPRP